MDIQKQIVERLQQANNVLVTVSTDPSVDQLSACIGLSLALNKLDKHAAAVYSGQTPSTIAFLEPDVTFEQTTDSLRDFIISLDKSKADKLRYKVEDDVVRIFITPYRSSITDKDLEFSQGDFNVDVVVALGVHQQQDLDQAVTAHGRILHDAAVITFNNHDAAELGTLNWLDEHASSLAEMVTDVVGRMGDNVLDEQIATALLTGIVAETDRFSNEKTTANTMKLSAALMSAGANQQLVATKLKEPITQPVVPVPEAEALESTEETQPSQEEALPEAAINEDGTLRISHSQGEEQPAQAEEAATPENTSEDDLKLPPVSQEAQDAASVAEALLPPEQSLPEIKKDKRTMLVNDEQEQPAGPTDEFGTDFAADDTSLQDQRAVQNTILSHGTPMRAEAQPEAEQQEQPPVEPEAPEETPVPTPPEVTPAEPQTSDPLSEAKEAAQTLADLEKKLDSPHIYSGDHEELNLADLTHPDDETRSAVNNQAFNPAMPPAPQQQPAEQAPQTAEQPVTMPLPPIIHPPTPEQQDGAQPPQSPQPQNPNAPPPVPPPIIPPFNNGQ